MELIPAVAQALQELRRQRPLIHHITNFVTMTDCANATLAIGASPTMTNAVEEVAEMAAAAKALVLNLGTLQQWTLEAMVAAGRSAAAHGVPIVFDPVGAGGTTFRTQAAQRLLDELPLAVIRGNASEITCLAAHKSGQDFGVDSRIGAADPDLAASLARHLGTTVAITGAVDVIADGQRTAEVYNGCPMLTYVTGYGLYDDVPHRVLCGRDRSLHGGRCRRPGHGNRRRAGSGTGRPGWTWDPPRPSL